MEVIDSITMEVTSSVLRSSIFLAFSKIFSFFFFKVFKFFWPPSELKKIWFSDRTPFFCFLGVSYRRGPCCVRRARLANLNFSSSPETLSLLAHRTS